jgi:uncharacterized protein (TIGR02466 family)
MNVIKNEWWVTPVWEIDTGFSEQFNNELLSEIDSIIPQTVGNKFDVWDTKTPRLTELKQTITSLVTDNAVEYFPDFFKFNPKLTRGWVNRHRPGQSLPLHDHGGALMAASYYIKTADNCGDLIMVDPRGGVNWDWLREGNFTGIKYKRVTPKESKLVLFPGYILHMVEANKSQFPRISLATNIISLPT